MILKVTEVNCWERERWTYLLDTETIGAQCMSLLMSFLRLAKDEFDDYANSHNMHDPHAISNYLYDFYDSLEGNVLVRKDQRLHLSSGGSYKSGSDLRRLMLSPRRLKKARDTIRDKKENILYKNFEGLFLRAGKGGVV